MNLDVFGNLYKILYTDIFSNWRYISMRNRDGTTGIKKQKQPILEDMPCRVSKERYDVSDKLARDKNEIVSSLKIFCPVENDIRKGDRIVAKILNSKKEKIGEIEGIAGDPKIYPTHQEIMVLDEGVA